MITIITPTYNRLNSLVECVQSVLSQFFEGMEFVVIDDCSTDGTGEYLKKISESNPCIKIISNSTNRGVNYSRNRGIEAATKNYILFLDSDDKLSAGSLGKVLDVIRVNHNRKHFLFMVSDRLNEFKDVHDCMEVSYQDWLNKSVQGDFAHVISTKIMKEFLFFEEFRAFEYLNWFRVAKATAPQLIVPLQVAERDRGRPDSLTNALQLNTLSKIKLKFSSKELYYKLYSDDLKIYNQKSFGLELLETIILGTASYQKKASRSLLSYALNFRIRLMGFLLTLFPCVVARQIVFKYSAIKNSYKHLQASRK